MDEDIKLLEDLYEEMNEFCNIHSYNLCRGCYIEELRRKYGLSSEDIYCSALYIVIKLLGDNQDSINYYMEDCYNCKYNDCLRSVIPCYGYTIGMNLLKEI